MKFNAHLNHILCKIVQKSKEEVKTPSGISYWKNQMPIYEIVDTGDMQDDSRVIAGKNVILYCNPDKIVLEDKEYYLVDVKDIAGYIED